MMRRSVDRAYVAELLQDESLSFREVARRAHCSDFSVRAIARELASDYSADDETVESGPLTATEWWIFAGIATLIFGSVCFAAWRMPPLDGGPME
jgi:hypothetical protein